MAPSVSSLFSVSPSQFLAPDPESIEVAVALVNRRLLEFVRDGESWTSLKFCCNQRLTVQNQEFFEFSDQAALSNLYWGIQGIEVAVQVSCMEERGVELEDCENKLQFPASLDEQGTTAGIPNAYLVSCSYFYLSVVKCLQLDHYQAALHFLQAVSVSPNLCWTQLAPRLCQDLFGSINESLSQANIDNSRKRSELILHDDHNIAATLRQMARTYKHWIIYQQVVLSGKTALDEWHQREGATASPANGSESSMSEMSSSSTEFSAAPEQRYDRRAYSKGQYEKVHPIDHRQYSAAGAMNEPQTLRNAQQGEHDTEVVERFNQISIATHRRELLNRKPKSNCLGDMLKEPQSDTPSQSFHMRLYDELHLEECLEHFESLMSTGTSILDQLISSQYLDATCHGSNLDSRSVRRYPPALNLFEKRNDRNISTFSPCRSLRSVSDTTSYALDSENSTIKCIFNGKDAQRQSNYQELCQEIVSRCWNNSFRLSEKYELCSRTESSLCELNFSEGLIEYGEGYALKVATLYEMLGNKTEGKYGKIKNEILEQLVTTVSTSKEKPVLRASISMLIAIISSNRAALEDIKRKGLKLTDLAAALKQNVHEAVVLIYLVNPSPGEMKSLELLPALVDVVCSSNSLEVAPKSQSLTPPFASLMIIEVLVKSFNEAANDIQLTEISSPNVLSRLLNVVRKHSVREFISLATILVKCMQFDGQCRKYISQVIPVTPLICLVQSNEMYAKVVGLELLHQVLCIPRSSAIGLLQQIWEEGSGLMDTLMLSIQHLETEHQVLAAGLLLQLDTLGNPSGKSVFKEEALHVLLESVANEESVNIQLLSLSILSNIGGTYAWTGESYTTAWLVKKAGLTSAHHRNMIRNIDWSDQCLQDAGLDSWSSRIARGIIEARKPVFITLAKALKSTIKKVSHDALTTIAWLGCEIAKSYDDMKCQATDVLLGELEKSLHPGIELEERLLACFSIYNYTSRKGMKKLIHLSEGVRESLRRFSSVTWMAEELLLVADYYLPTKSRISCVHTQNLEISCKSGGAVTALMFYKGLLCSGHSDGSIKVWDIIKQSATLVWGTEEHKKAVTCFALSQQGDTLLSGSLDKTIRVWQVIQMKLECIEAITTTDPIQQLETYSKRIFLVSQGNRMKVLESSGKARCFYERKKVKCMKLVHGRIYAGCIDSSIQDLSITSNNLREIKAPEKNWRKQTKPINSIAVYKDWIYSGTSAVQGFNLKGWRRQSQPQMSMILEKGAKVLAMEVTEDFIYLNCSSSTNNLQIWLRGTQQKVGRIAAGSRITSLLTANDTVVCGTEKGLIKGWIPL